MLRDKGFILGSRPCAIVGGAGEGRSGGGELEGQRKVTD